MAKLAILPFYEIKKSHQIVDGFLKKYFYRTIHGSEQKLCLLQPSYVYLLSF
ncbi:MAG: hypothetical protein RL335_81 [Bacteroidota bacterium]